MIIRVDILDPHALVYNDCRVVEWKKSNHN